MNTIAITGESDYFGRRLIAEFVHVGKKRIEELSSNLVYDDVFKQRPAEGFLVCMRTA